MFVCGDGGLATADVLLSVVASANQHGLNTWAYLPDLFDRMSACLAGADWSVFLTEAWAKTVLGR